MASKSRQYKSVARFTGGTKSVLAQPRTKPQVSRPAPNRPDVGDGIAVSIGPVLDAGGPGRVVLRSWLTFPMTPASIPVSGAAMWSDGKMLAGKGQKERTSFIGPTTEAVGFEGRLEPPAYYATSSHVISGVQVDGTVNQAAEAGAYKGPGTSSTPGMPYPVGSGMVRVVMEQGARGGPSYFLEPHAFRETLRALRDAGEVIRLVVGDQYGWNKQVTVRDFTWRYEDPDPDVILYSISFKEFNSPKLAVARGTKKTATNASTYVTRHGDTLSRIAARELKDSAKWKTLLKLNTSRLADMMRITPATAVSVGLSNYHYLMEAAFVEVAHITYRVPSHKLHLIGPAGVKRLGPDTRFVSGIRLKLK